MIMNNSVKKQLLYVILLLFSSTVIIYFFIWDSASQRKEGEIQKNTVITKAAANTISHEIDERINRNTNITRYETYLDMNHIRHHLYDSKEEIFVTDISGKVLSESHKLGIRKTRVLPKDKYFLNALKGNTVVTDLIKSPFTGLYVIVIYTPVFKDSKVVGVLGNELSTAFFEEYIDSIQIGKTGWLTLLDSKGYLIYSKKKDTSKGLIFAPSFNYDKDKELSVVERISASTGEKTVYTKIKFQNPGWYIVAFQRSSELAAPATYILIRNIATMLLLATVIFILWRYKNSIKYHEMLIERQNADKLALIGELAAGMAHEIRNPLTTIKGFVDLLKEKKYSNNNEILEIISSSVAHIEEIITEILLLAKPQKMNLTKINLSKLIEQVYSFMGNEALLLDIVFKYVKAKDNLFVKGDITHLKQLLVNLIKNSFEATPPKGTVIIWLEEIKNTIRVIVKDSGVGIKKDALKKIGTPFFTTKPDGIGLGLSVCLRIAHEHGGSLEFESKPGIGTTALFEIPRIKN